MNTQKQINIMVILIFLLLIGLGAYTLADPSREKAAEANQTDVLAQRGAALFAQYCRPCHGDIGQGRIGPPLNPEYRKQAGLLDLTDPNNLEANQLFVTNTITCGRVGTLMPTWGQSQGGALSDEQIRDLVTLITIDPNDAWNKYVAPASEAANKIATPLPVQDIVGGPLTGANDSVCGQKPVGSVTPAAPVGAVAAPSGPPSTSLSETTTDDKFSQTIFTVPAGQRVTITLQNKGQAIHNWHALGVNDASNKPVMTALTNPGQTSTFTFSIAQAGQYKFQCDVHPTEMIGTLFVVAPTPTPQAGTATPAP